MRWSLPDDGSMSVLARRRIPTRPGRHNVGIMKRLTTLVCLTALLTAACQTGSTVRDEAGGADFRQLQGATLVLTSDLRVPAERARIYLQDGVVRSGFNSYRPHCAFEIDAVDHPGTVIHADRFRVTRVQATTVQVVVASTIRVAGLELAGIGSDGSASYYDGYHFWLASPSQPGVMRMTCYGVFAQPHDLEPPTLADIRAALGEIATIRTAE